jgi:uncharacterized protein (TIGR02145 family)/uncharacterized repeat protein (TIGR02543 family)
VINTNRPPVITAQSLDTSCTQTNAFSLNVTATDPDSGELATISATEQNATKLPDSATFDAKTGLLTWKPTFSQLGAYIIVFTATDGKNTSKQAVKITVKKNNRPPAFDVAPQNATIAEGSPLKIGVHGNDPDNDNVTITADGKPFTLTSKATLTKDTLYWTPGFDDAGAYDVVFTASDGDAKVTATATITVTNTNRKPTITPTPVTAQRNGTATITLSATDPDGDALSGWQITKGPLHGSQVSSPALPTIVYSPTKDYIGKDTISYTVSDGKLTSDVGLLLITVDSSKIAPQITKQPHDTTVYTGTSITLTVGTNECFPTPTFNWYKVGSSTSVCNTQTFTKANITAADSGNYNVVVENLSGKVTSNNAHVVVNTLQLTVDKGTGGNITAPTSSPIGVNYGAATTITAVPSTGYNFVKWTIPAGTAAIADSLSTSTTITLTSGNATVKANFVIKTYQLTVTAASPGGTITTPTGLVTVNHGVATTITAAPSTGYSFGGWTVTSGMTSASITTATSASTTVTLTSGDATVNAKWNIEIYTVTFDSKGGSAIADQQIIYNTAAVEPSVPPMKDGYAFTGWYSNSSTTTSWDFATLITATRSLYAGWAPVYTVTYFLNGGTGTVPVDNTKYRNGVTVTVLGSTLNRDNYSFAGWNTQTDTLGTTYQNGNTFAMGSANVTLYAKWRGNPRTVVFNAQGGTLSEAQRIVPYGVAIGNLPLPLYSNCDFKGWFTDSLNIAFLSDSITKSTIMTNANVTYYARWTVKDIDGNEYKTIRIGNQTWTVENLKTTHYNEGTPIHYETDPAQWQSDKYIPQYCWYNNDATNKATYGALYNWYAVNIGKLAPAGWHVPDTTDWKTLGTTLGGDVNAGGKLKEPELTHWTYPNTGATNESHFTALPGGSNYYGTFGEIGISGFWWSASAAEPLSSFYSTGRQLNHNNSSLGKLERHRSNGYSVRLVR